MQTQKELRVSHGRKLKTILLALCFLTPFLTSAWTFNNVSSKWPNQKRNERRS